MNKLFYNGTDVMSTIVAAFMVEKLRLEGEDIEPKDSMSTPRQNKMSIWAKKFSPKGIKNKVLSNIDTALLDDEQITGIIPNSLFMKVKIFNSSNELTTIENAALVYKIYKKSLDFLNGLVDFKDIVIDCTKDDINFYLSEVEKVKTLITRNLTDVEYESGYFLPTVNSEYEKMALAYRFLSIRYDEFALGEYSRHGMIVKLKGGNFLKNKITKSIDDVVFV